MEQCLGMASSNHPQALVRRQPLIQLGEYSVRVVRVQDARQRRRLQICLDRCYRPPFSARVDAETVRKVALDGSPTTRGERLTESNP